MQIKDIQQFRTNWRNQQGYDMPNWDENFIGSIHGEQSGFYKMVNGIVHNIKADLSPKLQNAQDEQAIYEFLQNAADSQSTECAVLYDEQYFMVINNGKAFSEKDLKALLNSFQGTKADKTKAENCGKIGRYGIGFKLAYRLIGKSDGADELLNDLAGPLLFSWHQRQQFDQLLAYEPGNPLQSLGKVGEELSPWLLKIILACFPTAPGESVKGLDYQDRILFQEEEVLELLGFLKRHESLIQQLELEQGSIFFLKFGPKKHEKLKSSLLNIKSGIGYSLNTLKTLGKVVLQDEIVEKYPTEFEHYSILPGTESFKRIDPEFTFCPIEFALGFPKERAQMLALREAPSIYQYFPMRNERHGLAFFIHGTSFAKITDRTRLDDQGEANIESLKYISQSLIQRLNQYRFGNFERFVHIYQALLLSNKSEEYDAALINSTLYEPLLEFIRQAIPTHKGNLYLKDLVVLKNTRLAIDPMSLGIGKEWFHWTNLDEDKDLLKAAANRAKLGLDKWGLREMILEANPMLLNNWISNMPEAEYAIFVEELKGIDFSEDFVEKFNALKCFKFSNKQGQARFYAIADLLEQEGIFLLNAKSQEIKTCIQALGFSVLEFNIQEYAAILQQLESQLDYLTSDEALYHKLLAKVEEASLNIHQKIELFQFFQSLSGLKKQYILDLAIFSNRLGQTTPLKALLSSDAEVPAFLENFKIAEEEDCEELQEFLLQTGDTTAIYTAIILGQWSILSSQSHCFEQEENIIEFYEYVQELYSSKSGLPKIQERNSIFIDKNIQFVNSDKVFWNKALENIKNYTVAKSSIQKLLNRELPHQQTLAFYSKDPFRVATTTSSKDWKKSLNQMMQNVQNVQLDAEEKIAVFNLFQQILSSKDLQRFELFSNKKGRACPLGQLIPNSIEVPDFLRPYQVKEEEENASIQSFLLEEKDIYSQVIYKNWQELIVQKSVLENLPAFYQAVIDYASIARSPKSLAGLPYIYINQELGFQSETESFYHSALIEQEKYAFCQQALLKLSQKHCPAKEVLPFLTQTPFKTRDQLLAKSLVDDQWEASLGEATALIDFLEAGKEELFQFLCIEEGNSSREVLISKRQRNIPFALEKGQSKLAKQIQDCFGESYKLLPSKLFNPAYRNKNLLHGSKLFQQVSKSKNTPAELLSALIKESNDAAVQAQVFNKIERIELQLGKTYDKNSFEHQSLQIFRNKEADHEKVLQKIYILDEEENCYALTDIAYAPQLEFSIERSGKYPLELGEVLPFYAKTQALLEQIIEQFIDYEAPTVLKKRCFQGKEIELSAVYKALKLDYKQLQNAQQIAFILLWAKLKEQSALIKDFSLCNALGEYSAINEFTAFYIQEQPFLKPEACLQKEQAQELAQLLKINSNRHQFSFLDQYVLWAPYIERNSLYCYAVQQGEAAEKALLDFIYAEWLKIDESQRPAQLEIQGEDTLGIFQLQQLVFPNDYALEEEELPEYILEWMGSAGESISLVQEHLDKEEEHSSKAAEVPSMDIFDNVDLEGLEALLDEEVLEDIEEEELQEEEAPLHSKLDFLEVLGLQSFRSPFLSLRHYLQYNDGETTSQKQLNELHNMQAQALEKTIHWLAREEIVLTSLDERIFWLRKLYNTLNELKASLPLPYLTKVQEEVYCYAVQPMEEAKLWYIDVKQIEQLQEKHQITLQSIIDILSTQGEFISNIDLKLLPKETTKITKVLDSQLLEESSKEWDSTHYQRWKTEQDYRIFLHNKAIPYKVEFLEKVVKTYTEGNAVVEGNHIFINQEVPNIEEELFGISKYNGLTESHILSLLRYKNEGNKQLEHPTSSVETRKQINNPSVAQVLEIKEENSAAQLHVDLPLDQLPKDLLEEILKYAQSSRMIVPKKS